MNGEGVMGRGLWLGAPITHRLSALNLVGHWHGGWVHVHFSIHYGIVESSGALLWYLALIKVKNLVNLLVCSVWEIRCITLL